MSLNGSVYFVVNFHGIGQKPAWVEAEESFYWCDDPADFGRHLDGIAGHPRRDAVRITFDDGNASDMEIATPALIERGLSAAFFVCAGRLGQPRYLDAAAVRDMRDAGMTIGSHGWGHVDWRRASDNELDQEIEGAAARLEDVLGAPVDTVAIPFGSYDRRVIGRLTRFNTVYTSDRGYARKGRRFVPRLAYTRDWTAATIDRWISSQPSYWTNVKNDLVSTAKRYR